MQAQINNVDDAIFVLLKEIASMKARQAVSYECLKHLKEMKTILYAFGIYDPNTERDYELANMLRPHLDAVCSELQLGE